MSKRWEVGDRMELLEVWGRGSLLMHFEVWVSSIA